MCSEKRLKNLNTDYILKLLQPGDILLYNSNSILGLAIKIKTWHNITHVEVYGGNGRSMASRFPGGVDYYYFYKEGLVHILRPNVDFNFNKGDEWFYTEALGQKYDWKGLLGFIKIVEGGDRSKQFCSELATRICRHEGFDPFPREDADKVAPFQFLISPLLECVCY